VVPGDILFIFSPISVEADVLVNIIFVYFFFITGAMQGAWELYSAELQNVATFFEIVAEVHNKTASGFGGHLPF
jgi:hypothetical protein